VTADGRVSQELVRNPFGGSFANASPNVFMAVSGGSTTTVAGGGGFGFAGGGFGSSFGFPGGGGSIPASPPMNFTSPKVYIVSTITYQGPSAPAVAADGSVPDGGATVILLGASLVSVFALARRTRKTRRKFIKTAP
jgi:hypothetical protein